MKIKRLLLSLIIFSTFSFAETSKDKVDKMLLDAWKYYEQGKYYLMLGKAKQTLEYAKKHNVPKGIAEGYYYIGVAYFQLGKINKAIEYANKAIQYSKSQKNYRWKAYAHTLLAEIMLSLGKFDEALKHFKKVLEISKDNDNQHMIPVALIDIGNVYFHKKDYEKALKFYKEALSKINGIDIRKHYKALVNYNTGISYYKLKQYEKAILYFENSYEVYMNIGDKKSAVEAKYFIAKSLIKLGKFEEAKNVIKETIPLAKKTLRYKNFKKLLKIIEEKEKS